MSNIYEKLIKERNRIKENASVVGFELKTLSQLWLLAFENDTKPDELPKTFYLKDLFIPQDMLESLLIRLNINANVEFVGHSGTGASYKITQK